MMSATVRSRSVLAHDRLDAYFFTAPGATASERLAVLEASAGVTGTGRTQRVGDIANVWDPPRFTRAYASPAEQGQPYLRPYDVFDYLPSASDRLSLLRNKDVDRLIPGRGTLLQTCSGRNLGPVAIADGYLARFALSHDMIRLEVADEDTRLYLLAYLKTSVGQALLRRGKSGSVIDHVTRADVSAVPLPVLSPEIRGTVIAEMRAAVAAASSARHRLKAVQAEQASRWPVPPRDVGRRHGWSYSSSRIRDRLDAAFYEPRVRAARDQLANSGVRCGELAQASLPIRYKRYYVGAGHGRPILSGRQILQLEPVNLRYVADRSFKDPAAYELSAGMTVFGAVGRSEGRQGTPALVTADRHGWLASNDVMRLRPRAGVRPAALWLAIAAGQTQLQINALSFGSVVDHMNPWDVENLMLPPVGVDLVDEAEGAWQEFAEAGTGLGRATQLLGRALAL
jgi:hypothetical protein